MAAYESIPFGNRTALNHQLWEGWMAPSRSRGTTDVLYTCLVTIFACVYTAIYPNIPKPGLKHVWVRRTLWVLTAIIAPEYVLWTAFEQFYNARSLVKELNHLHAQRDAPLPEQRSVQYVSMMPEGCFRDEAMASLRIPWYQQLWRWIHHATWTLTPSTLWSTEPYVPKARLGQFAKLTYGFWVTMGGFRVDVSEFSDCGVTDFCLTAEGVKFLAGFGSFFNIQPTTLDNRKKASTFVKSIVCAQVLWMSVQCIARSISGLPLTLLELHTFVHVVCAVLMYLFWLRRPFDVSEAYTLQLTETQGKLVGSLYLMQSTRQYKAYHSIEPHDQGHPLHLEWRYHRDGLEHHLFGAFAVQNIAHAIAQIAASDPGCQLSRSPNIESIPIARQIFRQHHTDLSQLKGPGASNLKNCGTLSLIDFEANDRGIILYLFANLKDSKIERDRFGPDPDPRLLVFVCRLHLSIEASAGRALVNFVSAIKHITPKLREAFVEVGRLSRFVRYPSMTGPYPVIAEVWTWFWGICPFLHWFALSLLCMAQFT